MDLTPLNKTYKRILVGVDDSDDAQLAFHYAINYAKENNVTLIIASIWESQDLNSYQALNHNFVNGSKEDVLNRLKIYKKYAEKQGVKNVITVTGEGHPGKQIVKKIIPETKADLLIIGSLSYKGFRKHLGTQAGYMSKFAPISVMVVR
ncbi:universal stress protein [Acetilactobacillus jinshanensis]|uniref:Universal stress protein n=1 Tax=Acetilactobacillus jinshanensis TaxID=1720083 RepID=A0A4P6ZM23_9LACO|nr:universal stress protein [Acetilactobacillus jinshanensis]QBP18925.1 universal stress protein [Acetilactobacillus jinshanensis]URL60525.1 universal stress protein [uncultured bacterium]